MNRVVDSIGANIASSHGRYHFGGKINHLHHARGSLDEAKFFAQRAREKDSVTDAEFGEMMNDMQALAPKLNAYINRKKDQTANA